MKRRLGLIVHIGHLSRAVKRSMELVLMPVPLFLAALQMVSQILPGRE
jgi:hypothetical protein